jgi:hypothetical protein
MLPERKKQIADKIINAGFGIDSFELCPLGQDAFEVYYKPNREYFFSIGADKKYRYSPASDGRLTTEGQNTNWAFGLKQMDGWIKYLKRNVNIVNPWDTIQIDDNSRLFSGEAGNFTPEEQTIIEMKLDIILEKLEQYDGDHERIKADLEYLKFAGKNASQKDFGLMLSGTFLGWWLTAAIPPESAPAILSEITNTIYSGMGLLGG